MWIPFDMKNLKGFLAFVLTVFFMPVVAQSTQQKIYECYVFNDIATWKQVVDSLQQVKSLTDTQNEALLNYEYGYVAWCLSKKVNNKTEAEKYLNKAYLHLETLPKTSNYEATVLAYHAAFVAYEIVLSPIKAPFIGSKSIKYAKKALSLDSLNYFAHIQMGNIYYYMPPLLGGSTPKAIKHYTQAKQLMQQQHIHQQNWLYMNLLLTIADAYKKEKDWKMVKSCYEEALQMQPNYPYIIENLYPTLQKHLELRTAQ
jgi:tetratricopeptide (TPR) repeat protein